MTAVATIFLACFTKTYVKLTKNIVEESSRPLLVIDGIHIENQQAGNVPCIRIRNYGQGPAIEVHLTMRASTWDLSDSGLRDGFIDTISGTLNHPIGPNMEVHTELHSHEPWHGVFERNGIRVVPWVVEGIPDGRLFRDENCDIQLSYKSVDGTEYRSFFSTDEDGRVKRLKESQI